MKNFKKIKLLSIGLISSIAVMAQQPPTNNNPSGNAGGLNGKKYWSRVGNNQVQSNNNIFGTFWNSPIWTYTDGTNRSILNGTRTSNINNFTVNTTGFMGLGPNSVHPTLHPLGLWTDIGPFSLLHLNGVVNPGEEVFAGGYRTWMKTGITFSAERDIAYLGMRSVLPANNINEFVINWSNDPNVGNVGPDDMVFRFTAGNASTAGNINTTNLITNNDLDGLHIARFTGTGEFGLGNTFGAGNAIYVRPASLMHLSLSNMQSVWSQWTNRRVFVGTGTAENASDGLRIGILGHNINQRNGNALIYNQERRHLLFSTNANTVNVGPLNTRERMRITSINAPTKLINNGYGVHNPAGLNGNLTRVSISHNPNNPVTRPLSLLHLGYNTGANSIPAGSTDGWRNWMDIGTFTSNGTDNMYIGLKRETPAFPSNDRFDAVINWGDNDQTTFPLNTGPDNLRFIFTATQTGAGDSTAQSNNGLEVGRFYPAKDTLGTYGRFGVGDFTAAGVNENPTHKIDVVGNGRFRFLPDSIYMADSLVDKIVMVDSLGVLRWRDASDIGGLACWDLNNNGIQDPNEDTNGDNNWDALDCQGTVGLTGPVGPQGPAGTGGGNTLARNGLNIFTTSPSPTVEMGGPLIRNTIVDLNGKYLNFANNGRIGIGSLGNSMLNVKNDGGWTNVFMLENSFGDDLLTFSEIKKLTINAERVNGEQAVFINNNITNSPGNVAQLFGLDVFTKTIDEINPYSGARIRMEANSSFDVTGLTVFSRTKNNAATGNYIGVFASADRITTGTNIGIWGKAVAGGTTNYGVRGTGFGAGNFGGFFEGNLHVTGQVTSTNGTITMSDQQFKTNVNTLNNATAIINQLLPKKYNLDSTNYTQFGFDTKQHMGFIAQDVAQVLPSLVSENIMPAQFDTLGNQTIAAVNYKGLNYQEFIPLLVAGMQEQQSDLNSKDSLIDNLEARLAALEQCINKAHLCDDDDNDDDDNDRIGNTQTVILNNINAIILDQNLPNPFAEKTTINYVIPEDVMEATLLFYDLNGRIIKQVEIDERGAGKMTVYGENLETGIYTYSLIADGKLIATKKMVKTN